MRGVRFWIVLWCVVLLASGGWGLLHSRLECNKGRKKWEPWSSVFKNLKDGDKVEIPCGKRIYLDTEDIPRLGGLSITGYLAVPGSGQYYNITTDYVLVQGKLMSWKRQNGFRESAGLQITLKYSKEALILRREGETINLGRKVFAVVGGQVLLNGMRGGESCTKMTWTKLARPAGKGETNIVLDGRYSQCWKAGDRIVISSSSRDFKESEERTIESIRNNGRSTYITVDSPLIYDHNGLSERFISAGKVIEQAAEVGLLTRKIIVRGEMEPYNPWEGGHFIVHKTRRPQFIAGVEFIKMGQQGQTGRYPIHFHLCEHASRSIVRANAIHDSLQRGIVIHGTHDLTVEDNVFHMIMGHGVVLEDHIETGNLIQRNIGFRNDRPQFLIQMEGGRESDHIPAMFWITNPSNDFIDNVASGSIFSGYWFELSDEVRGESKSLPGAKDMKPLALPLGKFKGNVAHSNADHGFRTYPNGYKPVTEAVFENVYAWRNQFGIFLHRSANIAFVDTVLVDNQVVGIDFLEVVDCHLRNSLVVGRSTPDRVCPEFGAARISAMAWHGSTGGTVLQDVKMDKFAGCNDPVVHFTSEENRYGILQASTALVGVDMLDRRDNQIGLGLVAPSNNNRMSFAALRVGRTSFTGPESGYVIENRPILIPPSSSASKCSKFSKTALFCTKTCYRTVNFFFLGPPSAYRLRITRLIDNVVEYGPIYNVPHEWVELYANLLSGYEYRIEVYGSNGLYTPDSFSFGYGDGKTACSGSVTVLFPHNGNTWSDETSGYPMEKRPCPGSKASTTKNAFLFYDKCSKDGKIDRAVILPPVPVLKVGDIESYGTIYERWHTGAPTSAICSTC